MDTKVCTYEVPGEALFRENAFFAQHDAVVVFHTRRVLPVKSSRIIPCLMARVLASRFSSATSSASMS
jgi:hypothetical protein